MTQPRWFHADSTSILLVHNGSLEMELTLWSPSHLGRSGSHSHPWAEKAIPKPEKCVSPRKMSTSINQIVKS